MAYFSNLPSFTILFLLFFFCILFILVLVGFILPCNIFVSQINKKVLKL